MNASEMFTVGLVAGAQGFILGEKDQISDREHMLVRALYRISVDSKTAKGARERAVEALRAWRESLDAFDAASAFKRAQSRAQSRDRQRCK